MYAADYFSIDGYTKREREAMKENGFGRWRYEGESPASETQSTLLKDVLGLRDMA